MKKKVVAAVLIGLIILCMVGCSNPKRDALPTDIQTEMQNGTL
jgi:outer membrane murein-binding lipoprotein Lpp